MKATERAVERLIDIKKEMDEIRKDEQTKKEKLEEEAFQILIKAIEYNNSRTVYIFSYLFPSVEIERIINFMLSSEEPKYIHFFFRDNYNIISDADRMRIVEKLVTFNNSKILYNVFYDIDELDRKYADIILKTLKSKKDRKYIFKFLYTDAVERNNGTFLKKVILKAAFNRLRSRYDISRARAEELTPNRFEIFERKHVPEFIVFHATDMVEKALETYYSPESEVSVHFVVDKKGRKYQLVDLYDAAWGNGTSIYPESDIYYKFAKNEKIQNMEDNLNFYSFSICNETVDGSLTDEQIATNLEIILDIRDYLKREYGYTSMPYILGHSDIVPIIRTKTPGKNFPYELIRERLEMIEAWKRKSIKE